MKKALICLGVGFLIAMTLYFGLVVSLGNPPTGVSLVFWVIGYFMAQKIIYPNAAKAMPICHACRRSVEGNDESCGNCGAKLASSNG